MRASWMEDGRLSLLEVPPPERRGERLSRVTLAGISGTDLHMRRGYASYTGIPGHEFVGVVSGVGSDAAARGGRGSSRTQGTSRPGEAHG